jgi:hypothetical protein
VASYSNFSYSSNIEVREAIMKVLLTFVSVATLAGCAADPYSQPYYGGSNNASVDPGQWQTVSTTQVPPGTGARLAAASATDSAAHADAGQWQPVSADQTQQGTGQWQAAPYGPGSSVQYTSPPVVVSQPIYVAPPIYTPQPMYYAPAPSYYYPYYPPISLGLVLGYSWGGHGGYHGGHWGGGHGGGHWGGHAGGRPGGHGGGGGHR